MYVCDIHFQQSWVSLLDAFSRQRFVCCTLTVVYSTYIMVGWSIASISDLGGIVTYVPQV